MTSRVTETDIEKVDVIDNVHPAHAYDRLDSKHLEQAHDKRYDAAAGFLADLAARPDAEQLMAPWTEAEERAVVRKVSWVNGLANPQLDLIVLPLTTVSLMMGGVDKVILGTSATFGLREDLHLVGQQYSWASSISAGNHSN